MATLSALWKKDPGLVVSGGAHVLAFLFLVVNFAWPPKLDEQVESVPVEMITTSDLNQIMNGEKTAKLMPVPQRRVDKVAELEDHHPAPPLAEAKKDTPPPPSPEKANDDPGEDDQPTHKAAAVPPPPAPIPPERPLTPTPPAPMPPERPVEKAEAPPPKPEPDKPPPPDAETVEVKPPPRPKVEPKKVEPKKIVKRQPPKKPVPRPVEEAKEVPEPPKPPERPVDKPDLTHRTLDKVAKLLDSLKPDDKPATKQRSGTETKDAKPSSFSFDRISALLDHEAPQRKASTGRQLTQLASLGSPTAHADKMSPSTQAAIDGWLIDHYRGCWSYFGLGATQDYVPRVHVRMAPDGSLIGHPALLNPPSDPNLRSLADSAIRAVNKCDPLPVPDWIKAHYDVWRDRTVRFDPKEMS